MKKLLFPLFMLAMIVTSCEKDPDMNKLDSDYSVYTDYDNSVHFNEFSTYYLPDSILVPDNSLKANYWKDENANKNPMLNTTKRDYMAGIVSTDAVRRYLLPPEIVQAHDEGILHFHWKI